MSSQTLVLSPEQIKDMQTHYQAYLQSPVPYSIFRAKKNGVVITAYQSGKVLFQGHGAEAEAALWGSSTSKNTQSTSIASNHLPSGFADWTIIGSDEVGNGSYFGALTVCAVYLPKERQALMKELGVKDSKQLTDKQIVDLAWQIKECVPYHLTVCSPEKYNEANQTRNANEIKVSLHNFTLLKLMAKLSTEEKNELQGILIDEFTTEKNYYKYLKNETTPYIGKIHFEKKGESHHLAVACASIIARAAFLESLTDLGKPYNLVLPSGAGLNVDQIGRRLVKQFGAQVLDKTAKLHFANTKKILGQ